MWPWTLCIDLATVLLSDMKDLHIRYRYLRWLSRGWAGREQPAGQHSQWRPETGRTTYSWDKLSVAKYLSYLKIKTNPSIIYCASYSLTDKTNKTPSINYPHRLLCLRENKNSQSINTVPVMHWKSASSKPCCRSDSTLVGSGSCFLCSVRFGSGAEQDPNEIGSGLDFPNYLKIKKDSIFVKM